MWVRNTVTLTVTDNNGNSATCTGTVTVEDTVPPVAICQDITVQLSASGNASITAGDIDNGSSDACGIDTLTVTPNSFTCSNVGANTVTLTVTDNNGNSATCTGTVTVEDSVPPVAVCQDITVQLDAAGNASITAGDIDNGSSDACGIDTLTVTPTSFTCSNVGANTVTLTVTDNNGNSATCTGTVTVEDSVPPVAVCLDITVQLSASGNASITAGDIDNGSSDACGIDTLTVTPSSFTCSNVGANTVTLTVTDNNGNSATCTGTVTVEDTVPPVAICQDITVQLDAAGNATITANDVDNGSNDACGIDTLTVAPNTFTCSNVGSNSVTLTVTDNNGNVSSCGATVTVEDTVPPVAICQDITVQLDAGGNASITAGDVDNGSSDACGIDTLTVTPNSFTCSNVGANTVTLTVTDNNGNSATCTGTVTVEDSVPPVAICQDITVQLSASGNASITAGDIDNGSSDACGIDTLTVTPNSFTCSNVGANTVTLTVTDNNGNTATCTGTVTVEDSVPPVAICQDITVQLSASGNASITAGDIDNGSSDACGIDTLTVTPNSFTCSNVGANTVTLTVTDNNGNTATCTGTVTVEDTVPPVAICQDITVQLDPAGNASITAGDIDNGSSDACGIDTLTVTPTNFTCSNVGANTVTLTVTDNNGNTATCTGTVTVEDSVPPVAICQDITVQLDASGNASITAGDVDNGSSDACGIDTLTVTPTSFTCSNVGANTVTLTVTDNNGNSATCTGTVTVEDTVPPVAICQDITVQLDAAGNATITAGDVDNGSNDACGIDTLTVAPNTFTCSNVGSNSVTLTVTDNNGNVSSCGATVTVEDTVPPVAICQDITVQLDAAGNASITSGDIDNGSSDACGIDTLTVAPNSFTCTNVGTNTVTLTVTDNNGNTTTCTGTVTVEDTVPPVAICQDITVQLDAAGNASITAGDIDNGSSDACGIDTLTVAPNSFTCTNVGTNTVTLTVTDNNGNTATCTGTVTVEDTIPPVAICQDITVQLSATGNASITAGDIDNGSSDACGIDTLTVTPNSFTCSNVGANTVTLTVTDNNGNTATCTGTVTVEDTVPPVAICQDITVQLDAAGNASITAGDIDNGSSDACGIDTLTVTPTNFTCSNVGANTVTLTVTDNNGNTATCTGTVTVEDSVPPVAICQDITVQLDASGNAFITAGDVDNGSSDACGIDTLTVTPTSFNCSNVGANTVTLTVTDNNGNSATCTGTVTVEDTVPPVAICQDITVQLDAAGNATITAGDVDNGSNDACGIDTLTVAPNTFTCSNVGSNSVTLTVTDNNGNVSSCGATVTVEDTVPPVAICQDITVQLDAGGNASITAGDVDNGSSDACGIDTLTVTPNSFTCSNVGANTVTLTVTDNNGNSATCTGTVTVEDTVPPVAICQDITVQLSASGNASITAGDIDNGSSDACGIDTLTVTPTSFNCSNVGANTVSLTVTDNNGNTATCTGTVTVEDTVPPVAICQDITVQLDASGNASITAGDIDNGSSDACGIDTLTVTPTSFNCSNVGANTVTLTVTDNNGNTATCTGTVTVEDTVPPVAVCQDITVQLSASGNASITAGDIDNGSSDACGIDTLTVTPNSFTCSNVGANTVTLTVTDNNGNTATCTGTVTVEDTVPPVAICQDITVQLDTSGNASITAGDINNGSSDACGIDTLTVTPNSFTCSNVGANTVTLTVTDNNGNTATCTGTVTVEDTVPPVAVCQDITVQLSASGNASITAGDIDNGSNDACGIDTLTVTPTSFTCSNVGANTVTLTVTDNNGNSATCTGIVTVEDTVPPVAVCQDITVQLDASGNASITANDVDNGSNDACGIDTLTVAPNTFTCSNVGSNSVTLTVTDNNGNVSSCGATVTVEDTVPPVAICQDITVQLDASGNASITAGDVDNGSSDACGIDTLTVTPNSFTCSNVGANTVTLTVTDNNGNSATCTGTVTVEDSVPPVAICQDITVQLSASGNAFITAGDIDNGSSDACGIDTLTVTPTSFTCSNVGANTVTLTVTDNNGNTATCTGTVTVEDTVPPVAICQDITVQLDASGNASITAGDIDNGSSDACGIDTLTVTPTSFTCSNVGANTVTLTVTDNNGNSATCTGTVTVEDSVPPVAICQDITVQLSASGNASITAGDIDNGSSDACGIDTLTVTPNTFTCSNVGSNSVTLTVTDNNGNVSSCGATVTVEDTVPPVAICQDITVQLDAGGNATITAGDIDNGSNDACGIDTLTVTPNSFTCSNVGANTVTLTVSDNNGNTATCTGTVTVEDSVPPVAICQDITVQLDVVGNASITAGDIDNGSSDACGIDTLTVTPAGFTCSNVGANTVTLTVTDNNGNTATCTGTVTVEDTVPPVAICQDITVQLDATGNASITAGDIDNGSNDACGIDTLTVAPNSFTCTNVGTNTVTLTVTDNNGNTATCTGTVTIEDTVPPVAICQDITVQLDAAGNASITANDIDNGSNDACGIDTLTVSPNTFTCTNVGSNSVTLTVSDNNGNVSSCGATVTVEDTVPPVAICQDITVQLDGAGNASITAGDVDNGSNDACGLDSLTVTPNTFTCSEVGPNTVTLTVTDNNGNVSTCTGTVTVQDTTPPIAVCMDATVSLDGGGNASISASMINNGSSDICGVDSIALDDSTFTCTDLPATTVTLTVWDVNGNTSTCTANITVNDTVPPVFTFCPSNQTLPNLTNFCGRAVNWSMPTAADNCTIDTMTTTHAPGSIFPVGTTTVTYLVFDQSGNTDTCTFDITIEDVEDPVISSCPTDIAVSNDAGQCGANVTWTQPIPSDNCPGVTMVGTHTPPAFFPIGTDSVIYVATDASGNTAVCAFTVTVTDDEDPSITCPGDSTLNVTAGMCSAVVNYTAPIVSDNCQIDTTIQISGLSSGSAFPAGTTTNTFVVTDSSGNSDTCSFAITVIDNEAPLITCLGDTTLNNDSSICGAIFTYTDPSASDNCVLDTVIRISGLGSGATFPIGTTTETWVAIDTAGNSDTCSFTVTVNDTEAPIASCQNITIVLDGTGSATISAGDVDGGSSDNCGIASLSATPTSFTCTEVGMNAVTLIVTDSTGNIDSCTAMVMVQDTANPVAVCQDITIQLSGSGSATISGADVDGGSTDACGILSLSVVPDSFTCSNVGMNTVTLTVTDSSGNSSTCTATVMVQDTTAPVAICQDITVQLDASGNATITAGDVDNGSNDACGIDTLSVSPNAFTCSDVGSNLVTLSATDNNGNTASCTGTVTVEDTIPPVALCQDLTIQLDVSGNAMISPSMVDNGSADACGLDTLSLDTSAFNCSDVGANPVTLTVIDVNGNVSSCGATVTVEDTVPPVALCDDITIQLNTGGMATISAGDIDGGSNDACGIDSLLAAPTTFTCNEVGGNTVTLTVIDVNGNSSTCTSTVTVEDTVAPTALCQDITVQLDATGNAAITGADIDGGSSDNCGVDTLVATPASFTCSEVGTNTVTLTVTDVNGNNSTCTSTVTVEDTVNPVAVCQTITVALDATGNATITGGDVDGGSTDACGIDSLSVNPNAFDCQDIGVNTVTLTVTDNNGNVSTCTATVNVDDDEDPTVMCRDLTVYLDAAGNVTVSADSVGVGSFDNCGIASLNLLPNAFTCNDIGSNLAVLTATDSSGNNATCFATLTVVDSTRPNAVCQDLTVALDINGNAGILSSDLNSGSTDNCGIDSLIASQTTFTCTDVPSTSVVLRVVDVNGNSDTCSATVTVLDTLPPQAICRDITVQLDTAGNASITPGDVNNGSGDACGLDSLVIDISSFTCAEVGSNTVTLTVTDNNGNVASCTATVAVEDTVQPIALCQDLTLQLDGAGNATMVAGDVDNGSNDACGINSLSVSQDAFDCSHVGANTITLTATDNNGNTATCTSTVTVEDTLAPTAVCQNLTISLDATGNASIVPGDVDGGSTDNCSIDTLTIDSSAFNCAEVGTNNVTLTVTDVNGNSSTCVAVVTVEDTLLPNAVCMDLTIQLDTAGNANITSGDVNNGSNDACGIDSITVSQTSFDCSQVGANTVTLTILDNNGNSDTCLATVIVEDTLPPTAICQDFTLALDSSGSGTVVAGDINNGSNDNCGIDSLILNAGNYSCADIGSNSVSLTVVDVNGNSSSCGATVTVVDQIAPNAICQDITVQLDTNGTAAIQPADVDGGSNDNCGVTSLNLNDSTFTCADVGTNSVVLTVRDSSGNASTCSPVVTVEDTIPPTARCQDVTVQLGPAGTAAVNATLVDNGSTDNCAIASVFVIPANFTCTNQGPNTVTLLVLDVNGNSSSCQSTIAVEDTVPPDANCQDATIFLDAAGNAVLSPADIEFASTDNCGVDSLSVSPTSYSCADLGVNTAVLSVYDISGNVDTCSATVTVLDTVPPTAICQDITVQLDTAGQTSIIAADVNGGSTDNCAIATLSISDSTFVCADVGANTVTLIATDSSGNSASCVATVTVEDTIPPTPVCMDITIQLGPAGTAAITAGDVNGGSTDNCGVASTNVSPQSFTCADAGANTVTLVVTDVNGNVGSCTATVTVQDTVPLVANCQDVTVQLDATGNASIIPLDVEGGSSDNCSVDSFSVDISSFDCAGLGANSVVLTVYDQFGNTDTCTATVTVVDDIDPVAVCRNITVYLDSTGSVIVPGDSLDGGSTDNCGVTSFSVTPGTFSCLDVGSNLVVLTVSDTSGNTDNCFASVRVEDTIPPVAVCNDITIYLDAFGFQPITAGDVDGGSSDACGINSRVVSPDFFDCSKVGPNTVVLTITDNNNNTDTCSATVTVVDSIAPTAVCQDLTVQVGGTGSATITPQDVDNGSSDVCGIDSLSLDITSFTCADVGSNPVVLTVTDVNGNMTTCSANITVQDTVPPTALCQDLTLQLDTAGNASITIGMIDNGSSDVCGIDSLSINVSSFNCADTGPNAVVLTVIDVNGNVSTCTSTVTIEDVDAPVLSNCPVSVTQGVDSSVCGAIITWSTPSATDNCSIDSTFNTHNSGDLFPVGTTDVRLEVYDPSGNADTCSFSVTITDDEAPIIAGCPIDQTVSNDSAVCGAIVTWTLPTASDNCGIASFTSSANSGDLFPVGVTTVTYLATDSAGNADTCSFTITVNDTESPIITACPANITLANNFGMCGAIASWVPPSASDNCGLASFTSNFNSGNFFPVGVTTVEYIAIDSAGNADTCSFLITVTDSEDPVISGCPVNQTVDNDSTQCGAIVTWTAPTASDNCGVVSFTESDSSGSFFPVGSTTVTYIATDSSGNADTCSFVITVNDAENPVIAGCPIDQTVGSDSGQCGAIITWTAPTASDNCGIASFTETDSSGSFFPVGTTTVTYVATDSAGNSDTCSFTLTVNDTEAPVIAGCPIDQTVGSDSGQCGAVVTWTAPSASDNCGVASFTSTDSSGTLFPVGTTTVTYIAVDSAGNADTCSFTITVNDVEAPVITGCPAPVSTGTDAGQCGAVVTWTAPTASDNCGVISFTESDSSGTIFPVGTTTVTYFATDSSGNADTCTFTITITDTEAPVIAGCPTSQTVPSDSGLCGAVVTWTAPTASDNCGLVSFTSTDSSGTTFPVGTTTVTYLAVDSAGNADTCSFDITVNDAEAPVISGCPVDQTVGSDSSQCGAIVTWTGPTASDNCGIASFTSTDSSGTFFPVGTTTVTYLALDSAGNSDTCTFTITVNDTEAPQIAGCPIDQTINNDSGQCGAVATWIAPTASDNCGVASFSTTDSSGTFFPAGSTTVTYIAVDSAGNADTCSFVITVIDNEDPVLACPSPITVDTDTGRCDAIVTWTVPVATDNCVLDTLVATAQPGDTFALGVSTVSYTATDSAGNSTTCSFTITVEDNEGPILVCPADINVSNDPGFCGAIVTFVDPVGMDNCTNDTTVQSGGLASGSLFPVGSTSVTFTATDSVGNSTSCTFDVIVADTQAPVITCPVDTVLSNDIGQCSAVYSFGDATSTDNCPGDSVVQTGGLASGSSFPVGINTVSYLVTDNSGNTDNCSFTITVLDTEPPLISCPLDVTIPNDSGVCEAVYTYTTPATADNCGVDSTFLLSGVGSGGSFPFGITNEFWVTMDTSGNADTCAFSVTVIDTEAPTAICADRTFYLDTLGTIVLTGADMDAGSFDNCALAPFALAPNTFDCSHIGPNTVTLTVTDSSGNTDTCSAVATILDSIAPTMVCMDITIQLDNAGSASITPMDVDSGSFDNCAIDTFSLDLSSFGCADVGPNTVTLTGADSSGNSASCLAIVTVEDTVSPVAICQDITVQLDSAGNATITGSDLDGGSTDACGIDSLVASVTGFSCVDLGVDTLTLTVTDNNGNVSTCTSVVSIEDTLAPIAICQPDTVYLDAVGAATVLAGNLDGGSSDNCTIDTITAAPNSFVCGDLGTNTVTVSFIDQSGNVATCTATVTVLDTVSPIILGCPSDTIVPTDSANCALNVNWLAPTASDNCGLAGLSSTHVPGSNFNVGVSTVVYVASDSSGNTDTCSFTITVVPDTFELSLSSPTYVCGANLTCNGDSSGSITANVSGGCLPYTYLWNTGATTATISNLPAGTYTVTASDSLGNILMDTITLTEPAPLMVADSGTYIVCVGDSSGNIDLTVTGGADCQAYTYTWSTGDTTSSVTGLPAGTYSFIVSDANGCMVSGQIVITEYPLLTVDIGPDTSICTDGDILLNAGFGYTSYLWSTGDTTEKITVDTSGIYWVVVSDTNGCTATDSVEIDFFADPIVDLGPDTTICQGDTILLDAGGPYDTYAWSIGGTDSTRAVTLPDTISVLVIDSNGCNGRDTVVLTNFVVADPNIQSVGPDTICIGDTLDLFADAGFVTYDWSTGDNTRFAQATQADAPWVTLTVSDSTGCARTDSFFITFLNFDDPNPVIDPMGPRVVLCDGDPVQLDAGSGYVQYLWNTGDTSRFITATAGDYYVTVWNGFGCSERSDTLTADSVGSPAALITRLGGDTLQATPSGQPAYQWFVINGSGTDSLLIGETGEIYVPPVDGDYIVEITDSNGCSARDTFSFIVGVQELSLYDGLDVYPNPTDGMLNVRTYRPFVRPVGLKVVDMHGRPIRTYNLDRFEDVFTMDLTNIANGMYLLIVETERGSFLVRFMME